MRELAEWVATNAWLPLWAAVALLVAIYTGRVRVAGSDRPEPARDQRARLVAEARRELDEADPLSPMYKPPWLPKPEPEPDVLPLPGRRVLRYPDGSKVERIQWPEADYPNRIDYGLFNHPSPFVVRAKPETDDTPDTRAWFDEFPEWVAARQKERNDPNG